MAEEDEPLLRESGEGVTVTAGPEPGLQQSVSSQGKASERERERERERESVTTGARPVSRQPRHGNTKICKEKRQK